MKFYNKNMNDLLIILFKKELLNLNVKGIKRMYYNFCFNKKILIVIFTYYRKWIKKNGN